MKPKALLTLSIAFSVILISCSTTTSTGSTSNTPPDEALLISNLKAIVEAWNNGDTSKFETYIAKDLIRTSHGKPHFNNRDGFVKLIQDFGSSFPDQKVVLHSTTVKGNQVFTNWTVSGTNTGTFLGNQATGTRVDIHGFSVWTFDNNGILIREDAYWNDLETLTQLGYTVSAKQ